MRTAGIDLAAQDSNTALCFVNWSGGAAHVETPRVDVGDAELLAALAGADAAGIDAPFGWPDPFAGAMAQRPLSCH